MRGSSRLTVNQNKPSACDREPASPIEVDWPPCICVLPSGTFAVSGSKWLSVPPGTTFEDLPRYMVTKTVRDRTEAPVSKKQWKVRGSRGTEYTVTRHGATSRQIFFSCTCVGYGFRRKCKHIEGIKNKHAPKQQTKRG